MWPTLVTLWLTLSAQAPPRPAPRRRPAFRRSSYRPRLEVLEDRSVPASLGYSTLIGGTVYATAVDSAGNIYVTGKRQPRFADLAGGARTRTAPGRSWPS